MTEFTDWRHVKTKARALDPGWDGADRAERRRQMREQMLASVSEAHPAASAKSGQSPTPS
jgi:hypothetical protein